MPQTVTLPVVGKVDQRYAYAGGALIIGFVGYAWVTRSRQAAAPPAEALALGEPDDLSGVGGLGFLGEGSGTVTERERGFGFDTNAEWAQFAIDYLGRFGVDQEAASLAIGKFLSREPLDAAERDFVRRAIGVAGDPPIDRPWQIVPAPPPPADQAPKPLAAPTNPRVRITPARDALISWDPVPGAIAYEIRDIHFGGSWTREPQASHSALRLGPRPYTYAVRAVDEHGNRGNSLLINFDVT